jgi:hypothetical protein
MRATHPAHIIPSDVITVLKFDEDKASNYVIFSSLLLLPLSWSEYSSQLPVLKNLQVMFFSYLISSNN